MADINVKVTFDKINVKEKIQEHKVKILMLKGEKGDTGNAVWGSITGDISTQTDLQNVLNGKASAESVATNTSDISSLQSDVSTNTSDISSLQSSVATNTSDISSLQSSVATNTSNISSLQSDVATNTSNISSLQSSVAISTIHDAQLASVISSGSVKYFEMGNLVYVYIQDLKSDTDITDTGTTLATGLPVPKTVIRFQLTRYKGETLSTCRVGIGSAGNLYLHYDIFYGSNKQYYGFIVYIKNS